MGQEKLKIGIIGLGRMGLLHAAIINSLPESIVVAAADPSLFPAKPLSKMNPGIRIFRSVDKMFKSMKLDGAVIASPVGYHIDNAMVCIENKVPFLMEKPLALNAAQARELVLELDKSSVPNMIGYMARHIDSFREGKKIIESGALGEILSVKGTVYVSQLFKSGKGWRYDPKVSGGGVLESQGSHLLDMLHWYFGRITKVNADILSVYSEGIEDFAHVMLVFESGLKGWIDASWSVRFKRKMELRLDILGNNGSLVLSDDTLDLFLDTPVGPYAQGKTYLSANDLFSGVHIDIAGAKFTYQDQRFIKAILDNKNTTPSIKDGYHIQQIVDCCYESASQSGAPVSVNDAIR